MVGSGGPVGVFDYGGRGAHSVGVATRRLVGRDVADRVVYIYYPAEVSPVEAAVPWTYSGLDAFDEAMRPPVAEVAGSAGGPVGVFGFDGVFADPAPVSGPVPVVMFSHGFGGYPTDCSELMIRLASWGFAVVAPDHHERDRIAVHGRKSAELISAISVDDLFAAVELMRAMAACTDPLAGLAGPDSPLAALGHSAGAVTAQQAALREGVVAWVGWAPVLDGQSTGPSVPGLIVAADGDVAVPIEGVRSFVASAEPPVALVVLSGAGHSSFSDACVAIRDQGGLMQQADLLHQTDELGVSRWFLELAECGCLPEDTDPVELWPLVAHVTIAHIRAGLGLDNGSSLDPQWLRNRFGGLVDTYLPARQQL